MTKADILNLIARLRNLAAYTTDRGNPVEIGAALRYFADDLEADLGSDKTP